MTARQGITNFGIANIITICVLIAGMIVNYTMLSAKVDHISSQLQDEVIERKVEDERIRLEINQWYDRNEAQHGVLLQKLENVDQNISTIKEDLKFHLGEHKGAKQS